MPGKTRLLELALKGLEADRAKLDDEIVEIKRELNQRSLGVKTAEDKTGAAAATSPRKRKRMSAAARRKISEAMKRRYAAMRAGAKK